MERNTSDEILRSRLLAAYQADQDKTKMGRLRKQYDTIVDMKKGGMSLIKILSVLNEGDETSLALTMKTFNGYMYLLRKEREAEAAATEWVPGMPDRRGPKKPPKPPRESKVKKKGPATPVSIGGKKLTGEAQGSATSNTATEDRVELANRDSIEGFGKPKFLQPGKGK